MNMLEKVFQVYWTVGGIEYTVHYHLLRQGRFVIDQLLSSP